LSNLKYCIYQHIKILKHIHNFRNAYVLNNYSSNKLPIKLTILNIRFFNVFTQIKFEKPSFLAKITTLTIDYCEPACPTPGGRQPILIGTRGFALSNIS
jgi:hypothetical protein